MNNNLFSINISQWNSRSLQAKLIEYYSFCVTQKIDIACLCETFFVDGDIIHRHPEFKLYMLNHSTDNNQRSGGVALLVRRHIKHSLLTLPHTRLLEVIGVRIYTNNNAPVNIYSAYLPGGATTQAIQQHLKQDLRTIAQHSGPNYIICGDFNAKHRLWNCIRANKAGKILFQELNERHIMIHYPPLPTYHPPCGTRSPSTTDLITDHQKWTHASVDWRWNNEIIKTNEEMNINK